ncbi:VOC family protein [Stella sp.]|uniref:VOC family protein n=1 Tax=Stella sp. TaxID=2912054 RepID=UPI0035B1FA29
MRAHVLGIDHVIVLVRDLAAAAADYGRLGFTISPRGTHSAHMGTGNHTVMLERDYFELMGVVAETDANARWREILARREGMSGVALKTDGAAKAAAEMRALGVAAADPVHFSRPVPMPGGGSAEAAFDTTQFPPEATPDARMFCCQHLTPHTVWVPALLRHANTAYGLGEVMLATADPAAAARAYDRIFDRGASPVAGGVAVATGTAPLVLLRPEALRARYPGADLSDLPPTGLAGFVVRVRSRAAARQALAAGGVPFVEEGRSLVVAPAAARGALIEFRPD